MKNRDRTFSKGNKSSKTVLNISQIESIYGADKDRKGNIKIFMDV